VGKQAARKQAGEWLERLGVGPLADRKPADMSGGEAQRVALARALVTDPGLLLLDEPLSALDASTRVDLRRLLADHLAGFSGPSLLITHDPAEAFLLADQIHVIEDGAITQTGTADDIRLSPSTKYAADLAGLNLFEGSTSGGAVTIGGHQLQAADTSVAGPVLVTIHPRAISIHRSRPEGSPRNTWETTVLRIEHYGDRVRLQLGVPLALTAEITPDSEQALELKVGTAVWISIKATEIDLQLQ
jgi:molybdate transport system ATP-binding protein